MQTYICLFLTKQGSAVNRVVYGVAGLLFGNYITVVKSLVDIGYGEFRSVEVAVFKSQQRSRIDSRLFGRSFSVITDGRRFPGYLPAIIRLLRRTCCGS